VFFFPIFFAASSYKPSTVVQLFSVLYIEITQDHVYVPAYVYCVYTAVLRPCTFERRHVFHRPLACKPHQGSWLL
jgi:hypothetical protein